MRGSAIYAPRATVVEQILEYRDLIVDGRRPWEVRPVIVAERVNDNVITLAESLGVEVWRFSRDTRRFKALAGSY